MEILRVPPYNITAAVLPVSIPGDSYDVSVIDMVDSSLSTLSVVADSDGNVTIPLDATYDSRYLIQVDEEEVEVELVRPYVNPNSKADIASDVSAYANNEEIARAIIDSIISEGFYYKKHVLEITGMGADYLPVWVEARKVLQVYENNVLVYDAANPSLYNRVFAISADKTSIVETTYQDGTNLNRREGAPIIIPMAGTDSNSITYFHRGFVKEADYRIVLVTGYKNVPSDIARATELLVEDIDCGKLDYYKRYISDYSTDQFKIRFDNKVFEGTGNVIVDKILSKYYKSITRLGVL
jgi:hypothetical protein